MSDSDPHQRTRELSDKERAWLQENREAIEAYNQRINTFGVLIRPQWLGDAPRPPSFCDAVLDLLREHEPEIRAFGVKAMYLYGSTVKGTATTASDVDLLVDWDPQEKLGLTEFADFEHFLGSILWAPLDIATRSSLHPALKDKIDGEMIKVF